MSTSLLFIILAAALHVVVIVEVVRFFMSEGHCRESDKHLVATSAVGSVAFIVMQCLQVVGQPIWFNPENVMASMWSGFAVFNAFLYYGIVRILGDRRRSMQGFDATDHYRMRQQLRRIRRNHRRHEEST